MIARTQTRAASCSTHRVGLKLLGQLFAFGDVRFFRVQRPLCMRSLTRCGHQHCKNAPGLMIRMMRMRCIICKRLSISLALTACGLILTLLLGERFCLNFLPASEYCSQRCAAILFSCILYLDFCSRSHRNLTRFRIFALDRSHFCYW